MYITFEGPEASGKSTQVKILSEWIRNSGRDVLETKEPGCKVDPVCTDIRKVILEPNRILVDKAALLLFLADRIQHLEKVVVPHLHKQYTVVSDRSSLSTLVYHLATKEELWNTGELSQEMLGSMLNFAQPIAPDICFVAASDGKFASSVLKDRGVIDRIESKDNSFHDRVRDYFGMFASSVPNEQVLKWKEFAFFPKRIYQLPAIPSSSQDHVTSFIMNVISKVETEMLEGTR